MFADPSNVSFRYSHLFNKMSNGAEINSAKWAPICRDMNLIFGLKQPTTCVGTKFQKVQSINLSVISCFSALNGFSMK